MEPATPKPFLNRPQMAGLAGLLLAALTLALLPTCELVRTVHFAQPLEFYVLSDHQSAATPLPYRDATGEIHGFRSEQPGLTLTRVQDVQFEIQSMPVLSRGRSVGKQAHRFARLTLLRRDQKRLETFTSAAVGSIMLVRMGGQDVAMPFITAPHTGREFVISGPDNPDTQLAMQTLLASLPTPGGKLGDK